VVVSVLMLVRVSYTLIDVPHNALIAAVAIDSRARGRLAAYRFFFSSVAALLLSFSLRPIISSASGAMLSPSMLALFAAIGGGLSTLVMVASWWAVRRYDMASVRAPSRGLGLRPALAAILHEPALLVALTAGGVAAFFLPLFSKTLLYVGRYVMDDPGQIPNILTAIYVGQFLGLPVWIWLGWRLEKAQALQIAHLVCGVSAAALWVSGVPTMDRLLLFAALIGVGASGVYTLIWAMVADCADAVRSRSGVEVGGLAFAFAILIQKTATGLGMWVVGAGLDMAGYDAGAAPTDAVRRTMMLFNAGLPALGAGLCVVLLLAYPLTHARHAALRRP